METGNDPLKRTREEIKQNSERLAREQGAGLAGAIDSRSLLSVEEAVRPTVSLPLAADARR